MSRLRAPFLLLLGLICAAPAWAEPQSVRPGINRHYQAPNYDHWVGIFERSGREVYDRRHDIVAASGVQAGMAVADVGSGTGLFTLLFADAVGADGKVYAVDIAPEFVRRTVARARAEGFEQVQGVVNDQHGAGLPPASVDLIFMSDTYHHFEFPQDMLASLHRALRPGGTMVVVDFRRQPGTSSQWVMEHVRAGRETVIGEIEAAGFRLVEDSPLLQTNYLLRFARKPDGAD